MNSSRRSSSLSKNRTSHSSQTENTVYPDHGGDWHSALTLSQLPEDELIDFSVSLNPLGPPEITANLANQIINGLERYPEPRSDQLKECFAKFRGIPKSSILAGNGSNELIHLIPRFLSREKKCVIVEPTFSEYDSAIQSAKIPHTQYLLKPENNFKEDIEAFLFYLQSVENLGSVVLGHPNSPTGHIWTMENLFTLKKFCERKNIFLIIDEAFVDFCDKPISFIQEAHQSKNLIVVQSLTKLYCIPGARLGFCIMHPENARNIESSIPSWNVNSIAQTLGPKILEDTQYLEQTRNFISKENKSLFSALNAIDAIKIFPSETNFFLFKLIDDNPDLSDRFFKSLLTQGLIIRNCGNFSGLDNSFFRIAIQTEEKNQKLVQAIESFFLRGE
jgi:L-threonine-O-3-phosphate decarboxylase